MAILNSYVKLPEGTLDVQKHISGKLYPTPFPFRPWPPGHLCLVCPFIKEAILEIYRYRMESLEMSDLFLKIKPHTCSEKHSWNMHIYRMRHLIRLVHPGEGETTHFQGIPAARWFG